ncbi:amino acid permease [Paeniglutamicibacter psychrophenolicus]|uniref:APA family basic amino acid/polyamine antiporter n=1 Tax=Paeniglutamicibacter psychrophenolicus TaxID=257454 RepID=A0ABS4WFM0_9MICC|nr:amino acid permease [Paeniglutamicibacter psychrophenolicus]MBP2375007.1 APA family basic amino acid/polyamine antiporter [Paeniglutamicibacter psychrophenolicus]
MSWGIFRTKTIEQTMAETEEPEHKLKKNLGALDLIVFGVGVSIGAGIFVLTGQAAASNAGPAISISFLIAGLGCGLAALCYAELASSVPAAGSAYTYTYATMGELLAWIIGWDLILEFTVGSAALATSFSQYLGVVLDGTPFAIPEAIATAENGVLNLPAGLLVVGLAVVLISGVKLSSRINQVVTAIKILVVLAVIFVGAFFINLANWSPFIPPASTPAASSGGALHLPLVQTIFGLDPSVFGIGGVFAAAAMVFFAFIGFDVVATTAEETRNPQRNMPIGIFGSLAIVTVLYMAVSLVITGMQSYKDIDPDDGAPLATAFVNAGLPVMGDLIAIGACIGLVVVCMILFLGQTRVGFAMARDGLFPAALAKTHPRFGTPYRFTILAAIPIAILATFVPLSTLAELVNIGTLAAFVLVSIGVMVLRRTRPDLPRAFKVPWVPVLPIASVIVCFYLMLNLALETWIRFVIWLAIGFIVYFAYSRKHSRLNQPTSVP